MFLAHDGCLGVVFVRCSNERHAAYSLWRNAAAMDALGRSVYYQQTASGLAATGALVGEPELEMYVVTGGAVTDELAESLAVAGGVATGVDAPAGAS